jgi:hypothetical protein
MRQRQFKRERQRIMRFIDAWLEPLGLRWWTVRVMYHRRSKGFRAIHPTRVVLARVVADWRYMEAQIDVNVGAAVGLADWELERAVVHELCHLLVNELQGAAGYTDHEERVVQTLARAFIWVRDYAQAQNQK